MTNYRLTPPPNPDIPLAPRARNNEKKEKRHRLLAEIDQRRARAYEAWRHRHLRMGKRD